MIEENGRVLSIKNGFAEIETIRTSSCTACRARHGCGHHAVAQMSSSNRMKMDAIWMYLLIKRWLWESRKILY